METLRSLKMETCFETLRDAGIDRDQFWDMDEKDLANMGHTIGMRLRYRKGKKERDEMLRTMRCKYHWNIINRSTQAGEPDAICNYV